MPPKAEPRTVGSRLRPRTVRLPRMQLRERLDQTYARFTRRELVDPDPLAWVYRFPKPEEQEVAGLLAATLAFGNVRQILKALADVEQRLPHPARQLLKADDQHLRALCAGFQYRYIREEHLYALLRGMRHCLREHGSLGATFTSKFVPSDTTIAPALARFVEDLEVQGGIGQNYLLPNPARGSACKRLFLYLRWMVRQDAVDLGLWRLPPRLLVVPLDTHMHQMALALGLTRRKQASLATALEVTEAFRRVAPEDPVRYDFALTRVGIRKETSLAAFLQDWR